MKIYTFKTGDSSKFAYASECNPFDGVFFFDYFPEYLKERERAFWAVNPRAPGLHVDDSGSLWPDMMYCGGTVPSFVFTRKILNSLEANNIAIKRVTPIPIRSIESKKLKSISSPEYFVFEALPGIRVDYAASGYLVDANGKPDPKASKIIPSPIPQYDPATWTGADLFCQENGPFGPCYLDLLFTERIMEVAIKDGWTNVAFQRVRVKGVNPITGRPE